MNEPIDSLLTSVAVLDTPAFVFDEHVLSTLLSRQVGRLEALGCDVLFAVKSFAVPDCLAYMAPSIAGFAVSSANEARLAREVLGHDGDVHFTSPGVSTSDAETLAELVDCISFNSLQQLDRLRSTFRGSADLGLRVNPGVATVGDPRYDPCRRASKLGVPIDELGRAGPRAWEGLDGLLIHANCEGTDLDPITLAVVKLECEFPGRLAQLSWINLGGGYLFDECVGWEGFGSTVDRLRNKYGLRVLVEPGKSLISKAGSLVASVVDLFDRDERTIAVLDTSVSHMPEVFEYQFAPDVEGDLDDGAYNYVLAGATCLPGDLFGEYSFNAPLTIGSRVIFRDAGAYTLVKASFFNGFNLPNIYVRNSQGEFALTKRYTYEDFFSRCGAEPHVGV